MPRSANSPISAARSIGELATLFLVLSVLPSTASPIQAGQEPFCGEVIRHLGVPCGFIGSDERLVPFAWPGGYVHELHLWGIDAVATSVETLSNPRTVLVSGDTETQWDITFLATVGGPGTRRGQPFGFSDNGTLFFEYIFTFLDWYLPAGNNYALDLTGMNLYGATPCCYRNSLAMARTSINGPGAILIGDTEVPATIPEPAPAVLVSIGLISSSVRYWRSLRAAQHSTAVLPASVRERRP